MSSGPGSSGKPWPRLMALLSRASCDMASKIVTGRSANTLFMEVIERSAAGFRRQSRSLPGQHSARKMFVVRQARSLRGERGRYRSLARAAGKNDLLALRIRNGLRIESRKWNDNPARIGLHGDFVRLTNIDQQIATLGHTPRDIFRRQIVNVLTLVRHSIPPTIARANSANVSRWPALRRQPRPSRHENQAPRTALIVLAIRRQPASLPRPPGRSESENNRSRHLRYG